MRKNKLVQKNKKVDDAKKKPRELKIWHVLATIEKLRNKAESFTTTISNGDSRK